MSVADRFPGQLGERFVAIPRELLSVANGLDLTLPELAAVVALEARRRPGERVAARLPYLLETVPLGETALKAALRRLEARGLLHIERPKVAGRRTENVYDLDPLWRQLAAHAPQSRGVHGDGLHRSREASADHGREASTDQSREASAQGVARRPRTGVARRPHTQEERPQDAQEDARASSATFTNGNDGDQRSPSKTAVRRRPAPPDPDTLPPELPEQLALAARAVHPILVRIAAAKGAKPVALLAVGRVIEQFPHHDHRAVAAEAEHYWTFGLGASKPMRDVVATFRNRLDALPPQPCASTNGGGSADNGAAAQLRERDLQRPWTGGAA